MNKMRSAFGIDDILCQTATSFSLSKSPSRVITDKASDYASSTCSTNADCGQINTPSDMYMNAFNQPRKPYAVFPPTADVAKSNFYMPGLMPSFSPTAYLEQYANAMQKASPRLWPFYPHPYGGYFLPACNFKRKGGQVRFTPQQTTSLERRFSSHKYLSPEDRKHLAMQLKLSDRQVKTWFQNRRAKWRRSGSAVTTSENQHNNNYLQNIKPLNLQKNSHSDQKSAEKHINVTMTDDEDSSSEDEDTLKIKQSENKT